MSASVRLSVAAGGPGRRPRCPLFRPALPLGAGRGRPSSLRTLRRGGAVTGLGRPCAWEASVVASSWEPRAGLSFWVRRGLPCISPGVGMRGLGAVPMDCHGPRGHRPIPFTSRVWEKRGEIFGWLQWSFSHCTSRARSGRFREHFRCAFMCSAQFCARRPCPSSTTLGSLKSTPARPIPGQGV